MAHTSCSPIAVVSPQFCCPYPIELVIVGDGNYEVIDTNGNLVFKVTDIHHGRHTMFDADGNPVLTVRSKSMSLHDRRQIFRGQSTDSKDLIFSVKSHSIFDLKTKLDVFLARNVSEQVCDYQLKGKSSDKQCVVYAGDEKSHTIVAQMRKEHAVKSMFKGKDNYLVTVNPNIDQAFISALIVILANITRDAAMAAGSVAGAAGGSSVVAAAAC